MRDRIRSYGTAALAIAILAIVAALNPAEQNQNLSAPSTYDTGPYGYAALYELLAREKVPVGRLNLPLQDVRRRATIVFAGDYALDEAAGNASVVRSLDEIVRSGSTLIVLGTWGKNVLGLPAQHALLQTEPSAQTSCGYAGPALRIAGDYWAAYDTVCKTARATFLRSKRGAAAIAYRRGKGEILAFATWSPFDNSYLRRGANAQFAYDIFAGRGSVLFDERVHGYGNEPTFWQALPPGVRIAIWLSIAALLLGIAGANMPFAPARRLAPAEDPDTSAYIASLARMLQRGGAARDVIARLSKALPGAPELAAMQERLHPTSHDVLHAGALYAQLRKDYE